MDVDLVLGAGAVGLVALLLGVPALGAARKGTASWSAAACLLGAAGATALMIALIFAVQASRPDIYMAQAWGTMLLIPLAAVVVVLFALGVVSLVADRIGTAAGQSAGSPERRRRSAARLGVASLVLMAGALGCGVGASVLGDGFDLSLLGLALWPAAGVVAYIAAWEYGTSGSDEPYVPPELDASCLDCVHSAEFPDCPNEYAGEIDKERGPGACAFYIRAHGRRRVVEPAHQPDARQLD